MDLTIKPDDYQFLFEFFNQLSPVSEVLFEKIKSFTQKKVFKKGDSILKAGEIECGSNLVLKGVVHQFVFDEDSIITNNITPAGLPFNSLKSYIEGSPSSEIHEAITDVELLYFAKEDIEQLAKADHEFSYLMYKIHEMILLDRENRMYLLQYRNPSKRYRLFYETIERSNWMLEDTPDKYIASYLNMTPQQFSKEKRLFHSKQV